MGEIKRTRFEKDGRAALEVHGDLRRSRDWWNTRLAGRLPLEGETLKREGPLLAGDPNEMLTLAEVEKELTDGEYDSDRRMVDDRTNEVRSDLGRVPAKRIRTEGAR